MLQGLARLGVKLVNDGILGVRVAIVIRMDMAVLGMIAKQKQMVRQKKNRFPTYFLCVIRNGSSMSYFLLLLNILNVFNI